MAQYQYDEQGVTFYYFVLSFLVLVLIPSTFSFLYSALFAEEVEKKVKLYCNCEACRAKSSKLASLRRKGLSKTFSNILKFLLLSLGWTLFGFLAYKVSTVKIEQTVWDPYEVLGVPEGTPLDVIKKTFKIRSLIYHPDKAPDDKRAEYMTIFVDISKAYKVLTDEDTRKNYEEYGHPDGKQAFSMGIALPKWVVEGSNAIWVMSVYALIFGAGLPYFIARWWYSSRRYTKDKILNETMANYFRELKESSTIKNLIDILSTSVEFRDEVEYRPSDAKSLQPVTASIKEELESRFSDRFEKSKKYTAPYCHKACVLIYAQLLRVDVPDGHLLRDKYVIVRKSIHLLNGMLQISLTRQWLGVSLLIMELSQQLVQAIYHKESALMQLPHLTPDILRQYYRQKRRHMRSIAQLMDLPEQDRKQLLKSLSSSQYLDVLEVAKKYPQLEVAKAKFRVAGDKIVTPGSIITFVLKLRAAQPGTAKANDVADKENVDPDNEEPVVGEAKEEEEEEEEEALDAVDTLLGGKKAEDEEPTEKSHDAHAPYFPGDKKPHWWIFLGDQKNNRIMVPPKKYTDIVNQRTVKIQFPGPPKAGTYNFSLFVKSDSVVGSDIRQEIKLHVKDSSALPAEPEIDDDISEPDEDSIAGQMKLMREQGLTGALAGGSGAAGEKEKGKSTAEDSDSDSSDDD